MNRAAVIEQLKQTQAMLARLLALLQASEADKFVAHLYQARKTVPASLRASEQGQQGSRASHHRKLPDCAEPGTQRRFSSLGASTVCFSCHRSESNIVFPGFLLVCLYELLECLGHLRPDLSASDDIVA